LKVPPRTSAEPVEAFCITLICFGWPIFSSIRFVLDGFQGKGEFSDQGFVRLMAMELILGSIALGFLYARKFSLASLYPSPSVKGVGVGIILYMAAVVASWIFMAPFASTQSTQPIETMLSTASASAATIVPAAVLNGTFEETFLLGVLLRGMSKYGASVALGIMLLVRLLYHLYQGPLGAVSVLGFGAVLGIYYMRTERLFPVVFAHILADIVPFL